MEAQPYRRRRPALSCIECRRRKVRCDRSDPCAHCVAAKIKCLYKSRGAESVVSRRPQLDDHSVPRVNFSTGEPSRSSAGQRIEAARLSAEDENHVFETADRPVASGDHDYQHGGTTSNPHTRPDSQDYLSWVEKLEKSLRRNYNEGTSEINQDVLALQPELQDAQITLNKERVLKWNNWAGAAQEFETIIACFEKYSDDGSSIQDDELATLVHSIRELLAKCKMLGKMTKVERPSRRLLHPEIRLMPPPREMADDMVKMYLRTFESTYRILHVPTFWTEYERYWANPENAPANLSLKILLVVGIGSSLREPIGSDAESLGMFHEWVYAAQAWLSGPLEKDRLDINGLQIYCLTILARQISSIGGDLVWISTGSLIHRAMQMGLHRDPKHLPRMSTVRTEVRRRLWATILEMVVQSSLDSGMPPRISFDEFDTEPPANLNDDELNDPSSAPKPHPITAYTMTSMQLLLLDSLPPRLRAVQLLNGLNSRLPYQDVLTTSSEILDACRICGDFARKHKNSDMTPFHRNLLDYMLRRFLLPLHHPFAGQARTNPLFSHSLKLTLDAALAIMSPEPDEAYWNLRNTSGGLFKGGFRSLITSISLGLLAQVESQRVDGTLHRLSPYREFLKQALRDMAELSLERVRRGETNVKSHMFLNMILAQVEATEASLPFELEIARRAEESLTICHDLLRARIDSSSLLEVDHAEFADFGIDGQGDGLDLNLDFFMPDAGITWS